MAKGRNKTEKVADLFENSSVQTISRKEYEEAVLGAILLEDDVIYDVVEIITEEMFAYPEHKDIYSTILSLNSRNIAIDILTVTEELSRRGKLESVGGAYKITQLTNSIGSAANAVYHATIIRQHYIERQVAGYGYNTYQKAISREYDAIELLEQAEKGLSEITNGIKSNNSSSMYQAIAEEMSSIDIRMANTSNGKLLGVDTGFMELNSITGGWQPSDLIIIAARPSMGKTALSLALAKNAALSKQPVPVAFFSLEMSTGQLVQRLIASESEVDTEAIRNGTLTKDEYRRITASLDELMNAPLFIDDTPALSIFELKTRARKLKQLHDIGLIVIDYLQLMSGTGKGEGNREQEISNISRGLKALAKELKIPVIALSQLSRAVETRGGEKKPQLSDLRECLSKDTSLIYTETNLQYNSDSDFKLLSLNADHKIRVTNSLDIPKERNSVYRLKLTTGRYVDCTAEHPILTSDGYKPLKDIEIGEAIAVAMNWGGNIGKYIKESKFIGWMLGGGETKAFAEFRCYDKKLSQEFEFGFFQIFGFLPQVNTLKKRYKHTLLGFFNGNSVDRPHAATEWLKENGLWFTDKSEKQIPSWFMDNADEQSICELLAGIFDTHEKSGILGEFITPSIVLANQVIYLLARIGIIANLTISQKKYGKKEKIYKIYVCESYEFMSKFSQKVPIENEKADILKRELNFFKKLLSDSLCNRIGKKTTFDIIQKLKSVQDGGFKVENLIAGRLTKSVLTDAINKHPKELSEYKWLTSDNIYWDSIDSTTYIGEVDLFDRSVPDTNNFIVNGIIVHNSGAIEQDADIVLFPYRAEYYGILSDADGRDTRGTAELCVKKHRNGKLRDIRVAFEGKYTKFKDLTYIENPMYVEIEKPVTQSPPQKLIPMQEALAKNGRKEEYGDDYDSSVPF